MLILYSGIATFLLNIAAVGPYGLITFLATFAVFVLSASAVSSALLVFDRKTIANFRRVSAVLLAGEVLWLFSTACGIIYSWLGVSPSALNNALLFGAFGCAGLEFLMINGVFTGRASLALGLSIIHPTSTFAILRSAELSRQFDPLAFIFSTGAFVVIIAFTFLLRTRKTTRGHSALSLFQAFMKTWADGRASDLEVIIADHSEDSRVTTRILRFQTEAGDIFIVLPGVHPGPFHPVGSYDLPGVLSESFKGFGNVMTLHRPGGHERNLATREETARYAAETKDFALTISPSVEAAVVRGPLLAQIGKAKVGATAFYTDLLLTVSFSPLGSDDLAGDVEGELSNPASAEGFEATIVDAHNSIDHRQESLETGGPAWRQLFSETKLAQATPFKVGYSHSAELGFDAGGDLTDNGLALFMLQKNQDKWVLILADANNAVPTLREVVAKALESSGYNLLEFCTSDSHNLAAKGLTVPRGYKALGEETPVRSIADLVVEMARLAEKRLSESRYGSGQLTSSVQILGTKALEEFAGIAQATSRLGRAYLRFATASVIILLILSLLL